MSENKQITLEDVYKALIDVNQNITKKIESVEDEIRSLRSRIDVEIKEVYEKVTELETENKQLRNKIREIEKRSKRRNIVIYGLKEAENEPENIISIVEDLVINNLQLNHFNKRDLSNAFRIGKKSNAKNRPVLVELLSQLIKSDILNRRTYLKGSNIYISEDLVPEEREERKIVYKAYKEAKLTKKTATIKGRNLIIEGTVFTPKDISANKHLAYYPTVGHHSPFLPRTAVNEASTLTRSNSVTTEEATEHSTLQPEEKESEEDKRRKLEESPEKTISQRKKTALYHLRSTSGSRQ